MDETYIVVMLKNPETGILENELTNFKMPKNEEYMANIFALENNGQIEIHVKLSTKESTKDWEYSAIYDYYDIEIYDEIEDLAIIDELDMYDPAWEFIFPYDDHEEKLEKFIEELIFIHKKELDNVYDAIKDKEDEYKE